MLNEINFQRRKEVSYYSHHPSEDSIKTIYDYVLRQDSNIQSLEKEIKNIREEYTTIKSQYSQIQLQLENKVSKNEVASLSLLQQNTLKNSEEDIKASIMSVLCSGDYHSHSFLQLKNEFIEHKKNYDSSIGIIHQKLSSIESLSDKKQPTKDNKQNGNNLVDVIIRNNKTFDNSIKSLREDYSIQFSKINKRFSEFDNDFDRLIESLKIQFQTVNETLSKFKDNSIEMTKCNETKTLSLNIVHNDMIKDIYALLNKVQIESQRNESLFSSLSKMRNQETMTERIKNEMLNLRKEINEDFDLINHKILDKLQNQETEIKELYRLIENYQLKSPNCLNTQEDNLQLNNESGEVILTLEQEIDKKANIEQLNYAMEAQAKINEALCAVNRTARWSWSNGKVDQKGMILWGVQNINTSLDIFAWNSESSFLILTLKGIYEISTGIISSNSNGIFILINGSKVISSKDNNQKHHKFNKQDDDDCTSLSGYYALSEGSKVQIGLIIDETQKGANLINSTECFLEIKKII